MYLSVIDVKALDDYQLLLKFDHKKYFLKNSPNIVQMARYVTNCKTTRFMLANSNKILTLFCTN